MTNSEAIEKLRAYIRELPKKYVVLDNDEFLVSSYKRNDVIRNFDLYLVQEYSEILRMRVFPQEGALVGLQFDVFGFWKEIRSKLPEETLLNTQSEQYKEALSQYVLFHFFANIGEIPSSFSFLAINWNPKPLRYKSNIFLTTFASSGTSTSFLSTTL